MKIGKFIKSEHCDHLYIMRFNKSSLKGVYDSTTDTTTLSFDRHAFSLRNDYRMHLEDAYEKARKKAVNKGQMYVASFPVVKTFFLCRKDDNVLPYNNKFHELENIINSHDDEQKSEGFKTIGK